MPDLGISVLLKGQNFIRMLAGLGVALKISLISVVISIPLGIVLGVLMTWKNPITKAILRIYLEIVRIMPQMVLLFLVFFGTTRAFGWDLSGENASIIVFTFWGAAEMSDLVRGALISIPKHQYESSEALGLSKVQTYWYIIIPQTLRRLIPLSINLITRMIKTTSGCGKSTLLRCINALEPIQGGVVKLGSEVIDPKSKSLTRLRQKIGMVFQSYDLFPHLTVLDNILLAPTKVQKRSKDEVKEEAMKLLRRVGLEEKARSYPRELSGGQKQRVAIVRALCMHPEILLFDEVTAALDPEMVREVLDVILDLAAQGRTMIIVTHEMQFARAVADRIIFLEGGKIQEDETPDEFFEHPKTDRAKKFLNTFTFESVKRDI